MLSRSPSPIRYAPHEDLLFSDDGADPDQRSRPRNRAQLRSFRHSYRTVQPERSSSPIAHAKRSSVDMGQDVNGFDDDDENRPSIDTILPQTPMDLVPPDPQIVVHKSDDNESDGTSSSGQNQPSGFLYAQTRTLHHRVPGPHASDQSMDWEDYVVSSATDCTTPIAFSSDTVLGISDEFSPICAHLIKIFRNLEKYKEFLSYRNEAAQDLLDLLQKLLDHAPLQPHFRVILYVALVRLYSHVPLLRGGFGDIYKAQHGGRAVCVKAVKVYQTADRLALEKAYSREAVVWGQLSHPNILPFYGIYRLDDHNQTLCLVSPWMHNGNIREFLSTPAQSQRDRTSLISDVVLGMKYLHENGVVHGDLKSLNILVTERERACLADFGFSYVTESSGLGGLALSSRQADGGTMGFEAPELVESESKRTSASDVFAFGMVCFEIFTGELPLGDRRRAAAYKIHSGERPKRPAEEVHIQRGLSDRMWALMERCWSHSPEYRPTVDEILRELPPVGTSLPPESWEWTRDQRPGFNTSDATIASALSHLNSLL
ncbi:Serine/threonine-protein kinase HT1 [Termitomyces sp. J132]|nr:Serine/threonine-protein kinase HT1 [Termitomyces sp. J132]